MKILDHGYVKLIDTMGAESSIIEAARMSTGRGFEGWKKDAKLLSYLYRNGHMSPFEMCELVIEVQAPLFVVREWQRHRTFSYNEFSARYSEMPNLHYLPKADRFVKQGGGNKQGSGLDRLSDDDTFDLSGWLRRDQMILWYGYEKALGLGLSREVARINTPLSRYTKMRAKGNLRNWLQFLNLRLRPNAQWEIQEYARAVEKIVRVKWPRTHALFLEWTLGAVTLSKSEAEAKGIK